MLAHEYKGEFHEQLCLDILLTQSIQISWHHIYNPTLHIYTPTKTLLQISVNDTSISLETHASNYHPSFFSPDTESDTKSYHLFLLSLSQFFFPSIHIASTHYTSSNNFIHEAFQCLPNWTSQSQFSAVTTIPEHLVRLLCSLSHSMLYEHHFRAKKIFSGSHSPRSLL